MHSCRFATLLAMYEKRVGKRVIDEQREEFTCSNKIVLYRLFLYMLTVMHEEIYIKENENK